MLSVDASSIDHKNLVISFKIFLTLYAPTALKTRMRETPSNLGILKPIQDTPNIDHKKALGETFKKIYDILWSMDAL